MTKNVVIDLKGAAATEAAHVYITRDGKVVFNEEVPAGTSSVTLSNQKGKGTVIYVVSINFDDGDDYPVVFS